MPRRSRVSQESVPPVVKLPDRPFDALCALRFAADGSPDADLVVGRSFRARVSSPLADLDNAGLGQFKADEEITELRTCARPYVGLPGLEFAARRVGSSSKSCVA